MLLVVIKINVKAGRLIGSCNWKAGQEDRRWKKHTNIPSCDIFRLNPTRDSLQIHNYFLIVFARTVVYSVPYATTGTLKKNQANNII